MRHGRNLAQALEPIGGQDEHPRTISYLSVQQGIWADCIGHSNAGEFVKDEVLLKSALDANTYTTRRGPRGHA